MNTPVVEQETVIRFYRDEHKATIYTSDTVMMNKFDKLVGKSKDWREVSTSFFRDGTIADKTYECPRALLTFRSKKVEQRPLTEEEKAAMVERLRKARN